MTSEARRSSTGELAAWIDGVHQLLATSATERSGATWGPVRLRHRTVRPDWFAMFDAAWARPVPAGSPPDDAPVVDLVSAAITDAAEQFGPPPIATDERAFIVRNVDQGEVLAWNPTSGRAVQLRHGPPFDYETVSPLRALVHWSATTHGAALVHAATVGRLRTDASAAHGLLLVGDAGFGKSTSTLACLDAGWVTCGDDAIIVVRGDDGWRAESVYAAVKTKIDAEHALPAGVAVVSWTIGGRKRAHLLTATNADMLVDSMRLDAVVVLEPSAAPDTPVAAVSGARSRTAMALSTLTALPEQRAELLGRIGALCRDVPAYVLSRRAELAQTVADLGAILAMSTPTVSVVIPVHNGAPFVGAAIDSVLRQDTGRYEIIVVDDASTDDSVARVEHHRSAVEAADHDLVVLTNDTNRGVAATRNRGIEAASADFVAFLDQDDLWSPDHICVLYGALRAQHADAAFGRVVYTDLGAPDPRPWMRPNWFDGDHPGHDLGAALFRRSLFSRFGMLSESTGAFDDVEWYVRLRDADCRVVSVDNVVLDHQVHATNQSRVVARESDQLLSIVRAHVARDRARRALPIDLDVVIPVHNGLAFLELAVRSALAQDGADVRVVVVDDGSTDDVAAVVRSWGDARVDVVRHGDCRGIAAARNTGAAAGNRTWLAFLDADDQWPVDRTAQLVLALGSDGPDSDGPDSDGPGSDGSDARHDAIAVGRVAVGDDLDRGCDASPDALPRAVLAGGILCRRAVFDRVGPFDESLRIGEFVDWMARARALGIEERDVDVVSLVRRVHDGNTTRTRRHHYEDYLRVVAAVRARNR